MTGARPLTDAEVKTVAGQLSARDRALFLLGVRSGFRVSELLSVRVQNVLDASGAVAERVYVQRRSMKGRTCGRAVVLHPEARAAIGAWISELREAGALNAAAPLFVSRKGDSQPIGRVQAWRVLRMAYSAAGVSGKLGTHAMRKTFAARVYELLGHDLVKTQRALGHASVNSTVAYLSFAEQDIEAAILAA
ncbi:MAG: tyrosine-type recombinase/integrase [Elusimicrobia bacterium]|nr:tyrosine-type recombinase/integrase [Elusimicrobiota bacterium]